MEPVRGGKLASLGKKYDSMLKQAKPEWSIPAWAFHWLMGLDNVTMILSGMSTMDQIHDNVATFQTEEPLARRKHAAYEYSGGISVKTGCTMYRMPLLL